MPKGVTVDASVALSWVLPGEAFQRTRVLRDRAVDEPDLQLLVPPTFWYEVSNVLWVSVRRERVDHRNATGALGALVDFGFRIWVPDPFACLSLSIKHNMPVYDSAYIQVALERDSTLWTVDRLLARAAAGAGAPVEPL